MVAQHMEDEVRALISSGIFLFRLSACLSRYALNIKGVPYKTEWVEFPDIESKAKEIGALPTRTKADGTPVYTLPIINDPNTGKVISDSFLIAEYLDATYPDRPTLFPTGTKPLVAAFESGILNALGGVLMLQIATSFSILHPSSKVYFRRTREATFGKKIEEFAPASQRDADVAKTKEGFAKVDQWLAKSEGKFVLGNTVSYADCVLAGWLTWLKATDAIWKDDIATWHSGRWSTYLENVEKAGYATVNLN